MHALDANNKHMQNCGAALNQAVHARRILCCDIRMQNCGVCAQTEWHAMPLCIQEQSHSVHCHPALASNCGNSEAPQEPCAGDNSLRRGHELARLGMAAPASASWRKPFTTGISFRSKWRKRDRALCN